jgi:hypothetical protein
MYGSENVAWDDRKALAESAPGAVASHDRCGPPGLEAGDRGSVAVEEGRDLVRNRAEDRFWSGPLRDERRDPPQGS